MKNTDEDIEQIEDLFEGLEIKDEETAQRYMDFMQKKLDQLTANNEILAKREAEKYEAMLDKQPRAVRRLYQKTKFSDRFKATINKKIN